LASSPTSTATDGPTVLAKRPASSRGSGHPREESLGVKLLRHVRDIFKREGATAIPTTRLRVLLAEDEESLWHDWKGRGNPVPAKTIANLLAEFDIRSEPEPIRFQDGRRARGYLKAAFEDAWKRYAPTPRNPCLLCHP
jgi:hypothetical protein